MTRFFCYTPAQWVAPGSHLLGQPVRNECVIADGQTFFVDMHMLSFNMLFTLLPPFVYAAFEHDLPAAKLALFPGAYATSRNDTLFSLDAIFRELATACVGVE